MDLPQRVGHYIQAHNLLPPHSQIILGVSGGPDSLCLLDILHTLAPERSWNLRVAHLNHGLRPEAAGEAEKVQGEAARRGLAFFTASVDTLGYAQTHRRSIEEAAREMRYAFLGRVAQSAGATLIAVAHTADDQAETVLMRFLRGSGLSGLSGMRPRARLPSAEVMYEEHAVSGETPLLVRPLLATTRAEVEAYCAERGLEPVHDQTNRDPAYLRNRLRHVLLPELEKVNPNLRASLGRTAEVLAGEYELVADLINTLWRQTARLEAGQVELNRAQWQALSVPQQRSLLREAIARLQGHTRNLDFVPLEAAIQFSRSATAGRECELPGGLKLAIGYTHLTLYRGRPDWVQAEALPLVDNAGHLTLGWQFQTTPLPPGTWTLEQIATQSGPWRVYIDAARPGGPLRVRPRQAGDSFQPLGLGGHHQKISDYLVNAKVEASLRERWPLVSSGKEIVWLAGLRLDERFKVTAATTAVTCLEFVKTCGE